MVNGTVKVQKSIYNITDNLAKAGVSSVYTSVQGYTINDTNTASFLAVRENNSEMAALAYITNLNSIPKVNPGRRLWHANDCAFYKGNYFIAMGSKDDLITDIKCFDKSLERIATYSYVPMSGETPLDRISCIVYLTGDYFVVGAGLKYAVCRINETAKTFNEISKLNINKDEADVYLFRFRGINYERRGQGIFCIGQNFYKIFSYIDPRAGNSPIKHNDLAVFKMPGSLPYSGVMSFIGCYSCDRPTKDYFELESLASPDNGTTFYIAANVKEANATKQKDSIYSATLSNS